MNTQIGMIFGNKIEVSQTVITFIILNVIV